MRRGWVKVFRKLADHSVWLGQRFTRGQAWVDLILRASYADHVVIQGNRAITVKRGQLLTSQTSLRDRWRWNRETVRSFLRLMQSLGMVAIQTSKASDTGYTLVTLLNYELYQGDGYEARALPSAIDSAIQTAIEQPSSSHRAATIKKGKKGKKEKNQDPDRGCLIAPDPIKSGSEDLAGPSSPGPPDWALTRKELAAREEEGTRVTTSLFQAAVGDGDGASSAGRRVSEDRDPPGSGSGSGSGNGRPRTLAEAFPDEEELVELAAHLVVQTPGAGRDEVLLELAAALDEETLAMVLDRLRDLLAAVERAEQVVEEVEAHHRENPLIQVEEDVPALQPGQHRITDRSVLVVHPDGATSLVSVTESGVALFDFVDADGQLVCAGPVAALGGPGEGVPA